MKQYITVLLLVYFSLFSNGQEVPDPPILLNVSVDINTGYTLFNWIPSPTPEVDGYFMHIWDNLQSGWPILNDTIWGISTTEHTLQTNSGKFRSECYALSAFNLTSDSIFLSEITKSLCTISFTKVEFDTCSGTIELEWAPFLGWEEGLFYYTLYKQVNAGSWDTVMSYNSHDLNYSDHNVVVDSNYCYHVKISHEDGRFSTSYPWCETVITKKPPDSIYAYGTRFINENLVQLIFFTDPTSELANYNLVRYNETTQVYDTVKRIETLGEATIMLGDALPTPGSYSYRLYAMNQCGKVAVSSNPANLVWLKGSNRNFQNFLDWNLYHTWPNGIESYSVYRSIDGATPQLIHTQFPPDSSYTDNIEDVIYDAAQGVFCYYIEAMVTSADQSDTLGVSRSNTICLTPEPRLYIPNAFTPNDDGLNEEFKPVLTFTPLEYIFAIRSRWGNTIFQTNDPQEAWDGRQNGQKVPDGVYMYYIRATAPSGQLIEKNGKVTVLYPNK